MTDTAASEHPAPVDGSIEIDAPPAAVWNVVSDLKRMPEWSPQVAKVFVLGNQPIGPGVRMLNVNRDGWKVWPTSAKVTTWEPERRLGFTIVENRSSWVYELEPVEGGARTRLTERREVPPKGTSKPSQWAIDKVLGGAGPFEESLREGIAQTLRRIKDEVERAA